MKDLNENFNVKMTYAQLKKDLSSKYAKSMIDFSFLANVGTLQNLLKVERETEKSVLISMEEYFGDYSKPIYLPKSQIKVLNGYVVAVKGWLVANKGLESLLLRDASANLDTYHLQVLA